MDNQLAKIETTDKVTIVTFEGASICNPEQIRDVTLQIRDFVTQNSPVALIFDFSCVKFFSSQVLGLLLDIRSRMKAYSGQVVISGINPQLHRVFTITNLDKIFKFFDDKQSALNSLKTQ